MIRSQCKLIDFHQRKESKTASIWERDGCIYHNTDLMILYHVISTTYQTF